jgi:serine/threonine protein kinase
MRETVRALFTCSGQHQPRLRLLEAALFAILFGLAGRTSAQEAGAVLPGTSLFAQLGPKKTGETGELTKAKEVAKEDKDTPRKTIKRKARGRFDWLLTWQTAAYGGGGFFVLVIVLIVLAKRRQEGAPPPTHASDVMGGYRLQNLMMTGQTSQVWEVVEMSSSRHFAMKFLLPEKLHDPEFRELLYHEAQVGIELAHPNVIKIIKLIKDPHHPYFVMEFFPAGNLKIRIMHKKWDFIKEKAQDIFRQTATALAYMNASGWVHRDVKPDNIMVNSAGEVRIIDFALAVRVSKRGLFSKKKSKAAGTRSYMSPEQIRGEWLDGRADIYSFGASCYETITGRPPFRAASPADLLKKQIIEKPVSPQIHNSDVTDQFAALVVRMLSKKREERPRDFHEVLMELRGMQVFKSVAPSKSAQPT